MGKTQSTLEKEGFVIQTKTDDTFTASRGGDEFVIKKIPTPMDPSTSAFIKTLSNINHPHIVSFKNSFEDPDEKVFYIVKEQCNGGNVAEKMKGNHEEIKILKWFVQICMALKVIHEERLLCKDLNPKSILFTDYGTVCLDTFDVMPTPTHSLDNDIHYLSPETFTNGIYDTKSDIWRLACVLYEMGEQKLAFTGTGATELIPKILGGTYPSLGERFSPQLRQLLSDIFQKDPDSRPSAGEILSRPFIIKFIIEESNATMKELQINLDKLNALADGLENLHKGTTIGSLTGGVVGAAGGITSIVGLVLAPFTFGVSLIVTVVGVGVAVAGGAAAGAANIANIYSQSVDRKAIKNIVKEFGEKTDSIVKSLQNIRETSHALSDLPNTPEDSSTNSENLGYLGARLGMSLGGFTGVVRLIKVANVGNIAAQTARAVRVVEGLTAVLSAFFVAADVFFIALDAQEIHRINEAQAAKPNDLTTRDSMSTSEALTKVKSETMKFVMSVRQTAVNLKGIHSELTEVLTEFSDEILAAEGKNTTVSDTAALQ